MVSNRAYAITHSNTGKILPLLYDMPNLFYGIWLPCGHIIGPQGKFCGCPFDTFHDSYDLFTWRNNTWRE